MSADPAREVIDVIDAIDAIVATQASPVHTRLVVIRHGESNVTVRRVIGGYRTCDGLSALGVDQARRLGERLARTGEIRADVVIASNFERAIDTARIVLPALGVSDLVIDPAFGEHDPGPDLDGLSFREYVERFGTPDWSGDPHAEVFPGGETTAQFHLRVGAATSKVAGEHAGSTVVIVCHGGVIDAVFRQLLRVTSTGGFELQTANTSITEFLAVRPDMWRLVRYNDAAHLEGLDPNTPRVEPLT